jgi:hypothetical protein
MDISTALSFVTQDRDWLKKIAIGALLAITGIGYIPLLGWAVEISRRVIHGASEVLPDWSDFGRYITAGLKYFVVAFVWTLPLILLSTCVGVAAGALGAAASQNSDNSTVPFILQICLGLISLPYGIALGLLTPAAAGVLAATDSLSEALNPANAFKLVRANLGGYVLYLVIVGVLGMVGGIVGTIACLIGIFVATAYITAVSGHLIGQAYAKAKANMPAA